ncbi:MAG: WG repeat-containing protein [Crocinitomicaceae bacterium]|nr:WG repeat-containing protein [Crocinitomicaceae bacterium]
MTKLFFIVSVFIGASSLQVNGQTTPIPTKYELLVDYIYEGARPYSEGMAPVQLDGKWGFINAEGNLQVEIIYDEVKWFSHGLAAVKKDRVWFFINEQGKKMTPDLDKVNYFGDLIKAKKNGLWGAWDYDLNEVIPFEHDYFFIEDNRFIKPESGMTMMDRKQGILTFAGDTIIPQEYLSIKYGDGFFLVGNHDMKYAYFNEQGEQVTEFLWGIFDAVPFKDGVASYCSDDNCQLVDQQFNVLLDGYYSMGEGYGDLIPAGTGANTMGVINYKTKKWVVEPKFEYVSVNDNGMFTCMSDRKYGVYDAEGNEIVPMIADDHILCYDNMAVIENEDDLVGIYSLITGKSLPMEYQKITGDENGNLWLLKKNGKWSVMNCELEILCDEVLVDDYPGIGENKLMVKNEAGKYGFLIFR